jgi:large subunit ribosomal protein L23
MALFGKKDSSKAPKTKVEAKTDAKETNVSTALPTDFNLDAVLVAPRITEKAIGQNERNVYTFEVRRDATKHQVRQAIKSLYNVTPVKVNIVNKQPAKRFVGSRGSKKHVKGMKKAYVYLKKGESIQLV